MQPRIAALVALESVMLLTVAVTFAHLRTILRILGGADSWSNFQFDQALVRAALIVVPCQITFFFNDLYEWRVIRSKHQSSIRLLESCSYSLVLIALVYFGLDGVDRFLLGTASDAPVLGRYKASLVQVFVVIGLIWSVSYGFRRFFDWTLFRMPIADRVLIIGDAAIAATIEREIRERADPTYEVVGYILPGQDGYSGVNDGKRILGGYRDIQEVVRRESVHRVIVCLPDRRGNLPVLELLNCRLQGIKVEEGELLYERITGKIAVEKLRPSYLIFSEGFDRSKFNYIFKRALDLGLATSGLLLALPVMVLTAILIKLESRGPVLFSQARVGKEGRIFRIYKFRSMRTDAEKESGPVWARPDDDRVTRVGRVIRKLRIDEIPQLFNVLRNEMSFVGPRPERPFFVEELKKEIPYYTERLVVKPGITGWAQINYRYGASKEDALEKLQYDLYYIKNMSIFLDILILFRTVKVVLLGFGAR